MNPLVKKILDILTELDTQTLHNCYGIGNSDAPLDAAILAWKNAECPMQTRLDNKESETSIQTLDFATNTGINMKKDQPNEVMSPSLWSAPTSPWRDPLDNMVVPDDWSPSTTNLEERRRRSERRMEAYNSHARIPQEPQ